MPVLRAHRLIRRAEAIRRTERCRYPARAPIFRNIPNAERERRLEERSVDRLADSALLAPYKSTENSVHRKKCGANIGNGYARFCRRTVGLAGDAHDARH